jgi:hypothetical protein
VHLRSQGGIRTPGGREGGCEAQGDGHEAEGFGGERTVGEGAADGARRKRVRGGGAGCRRRRRRSANRHERIVHHLDGEPTEERGEEAPEEEGVHGESEEDFVLW